MSSRELPPAFGNTLRDIEQKNVSHFNDLMNPFPVLPTQEAKMKEPMSAFGIQSTENIERRMNATHFNDLRNPFPVALSPATTTFSERHDPIIGGIIIEDATLSDKDHTNVVKATQAITDPNIVPLEVQLANASASVVHDPIISPLTHTTEMKDRIKIAADELIHHPRDTLSSLIRDAERVE